MCLGPAVSLNFLLQCGHFTPVSSCACCIIAAYRGSMSSFLVCLSATLNAMDYAFHFGIFWFFCWAYSFFSIAYPFFINFFCWLSTILCYWALYYFLFFWKTCLQLASCFLMLFGLNFRSQTLQGIS